MLRCPRASFSITNTGGNAFQAGYGQNSSGTFTLNGGTLTVARPSTANRYFQDSFQPGQTIGSTGTVTVNDGTLNILCGFEIGINGAGIVNVNGGTLMDNGWFTIGKACQRQQCMVPASLTWLAATLYRLEKRGHPRIAR